MTETTLSLVVSCLALAVSALTAWLTLLRKGRLRMTRPTQIYFGPDGGFKPGRAPNKVYLRYMLYATGKRGWVIENMFVRLQRGETRQNFNIWVYGDEALHRGSGLFVPETGVVANHHFLLPHGTSFEFIPGNYNLEIFVTEVGQIESRLLFTVSVEVSSENHHELQQPDHGLYFDWGADSRRYIPHVRASQNSGSPAFLKELFSGSELSENH